VIAAIVSFVGLAITFALLPEPRGRSLEDLSDEAYGKTQSELGRAA
jgi:hypothetical protein